MPELPLDRQRAARGAAGTQAHVPASPSVPSPPQPPSPQRVDSGLPLPPHPNATDWMRLPHHHLLHHGLLLSFAFRHILALLEGGSILDLGGSRGQSQGVRATLSPASRGCPVPTPALATRPAPAGMPAAPPQLPALASLQGNETPHGGLLGGMVRFEKVAAGGCG